MDKITKHLVEYTENISFGDLSSDIVLQTKRVLVDTIACAIGGFDSEPSHIARQIANTGSKDGSATILGTNHQTTPDLAAFANGVAIRYLDYNDTYVSKELGHPSDNIAAVLAAGESAQRTGKEILTAIVLAYELFCGLCDVVRIRDRGFDYVTLGSISSALPAAKLMSLSSDQISAALSLAVTPNNALFQTRLGTVSSWKAFASANACRNALFAVNLASKGVTGPSAVFEGPAGFFKTVTGQPFRLGNIGTNEIPFKIMRTNLKRFPVGYLSQTVIEAVLEAKHGIGSTSEISSVRIYTSELSISIMADSKQKWQPTTRETADHSMPYVAGIALMYGTVDICHFEHQYFTDLQLLSLIQKIEVYPSTEANKLPPDAMLSIVEIETYTGEVFSGRVICHKGHADNPMSENELEEKFYTQTHNRLPDYAAKELINNIWNIELVDDIGSLLRLIKL